MSEFQELSQKIRARVQEVPDFPKPGISFKDLTPVFGDGALQRELCHALAERYRKRRIDTIVAIESRGFIVGAPLAVELGVGLALVRKRGKLPWKTVSKSYELEYGKDTLEMHEDAVKLGHRVLVVDDLLATGGTAGATCDLVRSTGGEVVEAAFVIELAFLEGRGRLEGIDCHAIVTY